MVGATFRTLQVEGPGPGEALIRVLACGICHADLHVIEGDLPRRRTPVTPGHQIVGEAEAIGDGVQGVRLGDRIGLSWLYSTCASDLQEDR